MSAPFYVEGRSSPRPDDKRYLAAHLYVAETDEGAVLLDLRSLQYYAIDSLSIPQLRRDIVDWPRSPTPLNASSSASALSDTSLDVLTSAGLLSLTPAQRPFVPNRSVVVRACHPIWDHRATATDTLLMAARLAAAYGLTIAHLRRNALEALLTRMLPVASGRTNTGRVASQDRISELVTLYAKLRVWLYTAQSRCLFDSLVFLGVLRKYALPATLTIGVTLRPFAAHAWVQIGDCVLDDSVEHVREYTPILAA